MSWRPGEFGRACAIAAWIAVPAAASLWHAQALAVESATALQARYDSLRNVLLDTEFRRPIHLDSTVADGSASGDVYAVLDYPFDTTMAALSTAPACRASPRCCGSGRRGARSAMPRRPV